MIVSPWFTIDKSGVHLTASSEPLEYAGALFHFKISITTTGTPNHSPVSESIAVSYDLLVTSITDPQNVCRTVFCGTLEIGRAHV